MPKKLGLNSKAVEARDRKAAVKKAADDKTKKEAEDALWVDDDKQLAKKKKQKEEEEKKRAELLRKKAEVKAQLEEEMNAIKISTAPKQSVQKITRAHIEAEVEKRNKNIEDINNPAAPVVPKVIPLEENLNRLMHDVEVARTVDEAIQVLDIKDPEVDKHPEKRMKAAFKEFEELNFNRIKSENPSLKLSQLKQIMQKEWNKSPMNPMNNR